MLKRPRTPTNNSAVDYQTADSEHMLKRSRPFGVSDEVCYIILSCLHISMYLTELYDRNCCLQIGSYFRKFFDAFVF